MNKLLYIIIGILSLSSCGHSNKFVLQGELPEYPYENIVVVYDDPISKLDTIFPRDGKFIYEIIPDTVTLFRLLTPDQQCIPIVAEKGDKVRMGGSFSKPIFDTKGANRVYAEFRESIDGLKEDQIPTKAEACIKANPQSFVSAYLINQYFAQAKSPDIEKIKSLIDPLNGSIKDTRVLTVLLKQLETDKKKNQNADRFGYFSYKDRNWKFISWNIEEGGCLLVNLWASWDKASISRRDSIYRMTTKFSEGKFRVINISLDSNQKAWKAACKEDSKQWTEACDFKGWASAIVSQHEIASLPANLLINRERKIIGRNLFDDALYKIVKQHTDKGKQ